MKQKMDSSTVVHQHSDTLVFIDSTIQVWFSKDCFSFNVSLLQSLAQVCVYQEGEESSYGFKPVIFLGWRRLNQRGR